MSDTINVQALFNDSPRSSDLKDFFESFDKSMYDEQSTQDLKLQVCKALLSKFKNLKQTPNELLNFLTKTFVCNTQFCKFCLDTQVFDVPQVKKALDFASTQNGYMNFAHFFKHTLDSFPNFNMTLNDLQLVLHNDKQLFVDTLEKNLFRSVLKTHSAQELVESKLKTAFDLPTKLKTTQELEENTKYERLKKVFFDVKFVDYLIENDIFISPKFEKTPLYDLFDKALSHVQGASNFAEVLSEYLDQTRLTRTPEQQDKLKSKIEQFRLVNYADDFVSSLATREYMFLENASVFDDEFIDKVVAYDIERQTKKNLTRSISKVKDSLKSLENGIADAYEKTKTHVADLGIEAALQALRATGNIFEESISYVSVKRTRIL